MGMTPARFIKTLRIASKSKSSKLWMRVWRDLEEVGSPLREWLVDIEDWADSKLPTVEHVPPQILPCAPTAKLRPRPRIVIHATPIMIDYREYRRGTASQEAIARVKAALADSSSELSRLLTNVSGSFASARNMGEKVEYNKADKNLSPRAHQILIYLLRGHDEQAIAEMLSLPPRAVRDFIKEIYRHYKLSGRNELIAKMIIHRESNDAKNT